MKKVHKDNVIKALHDLASYDFQKKAWFAASGPVVSDFMEDVCVLFDDTGLKDALNANQTVFGEKADNALRVLHDATHKVNYKNVPHETIIDDPHMQAVREKAADALQLITPDSV